MTKVFIAEQIPSYNKGEEAILKGLLKNLPGSQNCHVTLVSSYPYQDMKFYGAQVKLIPVVNTLPETIQLNVRFLLSVLRQGVEHLFFMLLFKIFGKKAIKIMKGAIWKEYLAADVIVIGHDSILGFERVVLFLSFFNVIKKRVIIYAGSFPQLGNTVKEKISSFLLNRVECISLREKLSYEYLRKIGVKSNMFVTADPAFLVDPCSPERLDAILAQKCYHKRHSRIIGVTPSKILSRYIPSGSTIDEKYSINIQTMADIIDMLVTELHADIFLIPHVFGSGVLAKDDLNDALMAELIRAKCKNQSRIFLFDKQMTADETKALISICDLFIGERLHSIIDAASSCVPFIAILEKTNRTLGILEDLTVNGRGFYDVKRLTFVSLSYEIHYVWENKETIKKWLEVQSLHSKHMAAKNIKCFDGIL